MKPHNRRRASDWPLFLEEARENWNSLGAVVPSSRRMAESITACIPHPSSTGFISPAGGPSSGGGTYEIVSSEDKPKRILEVGAGTGRFTSCILPKMRRGDSLVIYEPNPRFMEYLRDQIRAHPAHLDLDIELRMEFFPGVGPISRHGHFNYGVCGLPFNSFPIEITRHIMDAFVRVFSPGGILSYFEYCGLREFRMFLSLKEETRANYRSIESHLSEYHRRYRISRSFVAGNIPPAWVHTLQFSRKSK